MDETNIANADVNEIAWETRKIGIEGMNCNHCVQKIEQALGAVPGVKEVHVDLDGKTATVIYDRRKTDMPAIHDVLLRTGYKPSDTPDLD
ncbi:MAG: heavy-metal-associated domain-containing protein [Verrucomicrobiota bacterium]|jgi:copper ion binding protein